MKFQLFNTAHKVYQHWLPSTFSTFCPFSSQYAVFSHLSIKQHAEWLPSKFFFIIQSSVQLSSLKTPSLSPLLLCHSSLVLPLYLACITIITHSKYVIIYLVFDSTPPTYSNTLLRQFSPPTLPLSGFPSLVNYSYEHTNIL